MNKQSGSLETRTAIVVGGSLGGLTAAALLKREGWAVTVFERSHMMLDGAGAGIVFMTRPFATWSTTVA